LFVGATNKTGSQKGRQAVMYHFSKTIS